MKAPMLACSENVTFEDLPELLERHGTLWGTTKVDGIRCIIESEGSEKEGLSRAGLELPNAIIQDWIKECKAVVPNMDGEIVIPGRQFWEVESWVMTRFTAPAPFKYVVFDYRTENSNLGYLQRLQKLKKLYKFNNRMLWYLSPKPLSTVEEIISYFTSEIERGEEGIILKTGDSPYKHGRSTWNEGYALKMKKRKEGEACILAVVEANENINEKELDKFGKTKRSKKKEGMRGKGTMGALICRDIITGVIFKLGSGWDQALAQHIYDNEEDFIEEILTYTYHDHGKKNKPRNASFKAMRNFKY